LPNTHSKFSIPYIEGRRKKEEGRRKKEEGRKKRVNN
jgi:hypothetical protein